MEQEFPLATVEALVDAGIGRFHVFEGDGLSVTEVRQLEPLKHPDEGLRPPQLLGDAELDIVASVGHHISLEQREMQN